ncbi:5330_t:CDS:2 [Diversispora eburnea]|uniref:5330_t:CDS:1 n=1 Tax=Diversispora eburnea TaxID=1213867 RepID=A0A9N9A3B4_9GLOM|nr:5330_t:CDS:2 [Diversispora eburnea]
MASTFFSDMADDFKQLFETMECYDIKIYAGEDSQEIHVHSLVLRARSPYFRGPFKRMGEERRCLILILKYDDLEIDEMNYDFKLWRKIISEEFEDDILRCYMVPDAIPALNMFPPRKMMEKVTLFIKNMITQNSENLVGDYNPLDWNSNGYKNTSGSFLFSISDKNNISGATIGRISQKLWLCYIWWQMW